MAGKKENSSLVIVESPSKAHKIASYVGPDTKVMASVGHVRDLPTYRLGVAVSNGFAPHYEVPRDKREVVDSLRKAAAKVSTVYLASDPDREGESIAWHLREVLKDVPGDRKFYRVRYNEVTKGAVLDALAHPTEIDQNLVNAQQARRIEDRLSGFKLSKLVSQSIRGAKSAGRVQSVALRLIVDRERAVQAFRPTPYWLIGARLSKGPTMFVARLASVDGKAPKFMAYDKEVQGIQDEATADAYIKDLTGRNAAVIGIDRKTLTRRPQPPFITSTLQQSAATHLGYSPDQTMRLAQALYEEGYITYMRTDGYTVSASIRSAVEAEIEKLFGRECVPASPNFYGNKVKNAQEAHEPIRPTDVTKREIPGLDPQQAKLYDLIWKRFVASQMAPAKVERTTLTFEPTTPPPTQHAYRLTASAQQVIFKGFLSVWDGKEKAQALPQEEGDATRLPIVNVGDVLTCEEWLCEGKETQPPARYNEASLVKALEETGTGRPSTYASTIRTLLSREYVKSGRGHVLTPTEMGIATIDYLLQQTPDFVNVEFTAQMEDALDKVAEGALDWEREVADFYAKLTEWLAADPARVTPVMEQLAHVTQWREPTVGKSGKVTWDDQAFYNDMKAQLESGEPLSKTQLAILTRVAISYRDQLPGLEAVVELPPAVDRAEVERLFAALADRELTPWEQRFFESVKIQFERKGDLSPKQLAMLKRIADPGESAANQADPEAARALLEAIANVKDWNEPVTRGKRVYDDCAFVQSLTEQLDTRKFLTERQFSALKRLVVGYRAQIPGYVELAAKYGLKEPAKRAAKGAKRAPKKKE